MTGKWTDGTWVVVQPADEFDNITVCAFEGDPRDGIMSEVVAEVISCDDERDARLIAAAPALYEALHDICALLNSAGIANLSRGVELGQASWYATATDRMKAAEIALSQALGEGT